jgi:TPR repeat protein
MKEKANQSLIRRPTSSVEKAEPGMKRVLSGMVAETLALAKSNDADLESLCQRGERYYWGRGVRQDTSEALRWFRMAADRGHARAQCWLASFNLWNPHGRLEAYLDAEKWSRKAADQGYDHGQNQLGECYQLGWAVPQNDSEAVKWFLKAAVQGHPRGQIHLGQCYREGRGVVRDPCEAFKWFKLAANNPASESYKWFDLADPRPVQQGREYAAEQLTALSPTMSPDQLGEGERLYRESEASL